MTIKTTLFTLFLYLTTALNAQQIQYGWRNYTTNDGLPSPEVYTVIQDKKGYLWFGTDNGVSRFDGYTFQNFGVKESLADNVINGIQEDELGRVWFSSMWGNLYYFEKDSIRSFAYNHIIESYKKSFYLVNGFSRLQKTAHTEGGVLLGLSNLGILKITDSGKSELITAPEVPALLLFLSDKQKVGVRQVQLNGRSFSPFLNNGQCPLYIYDGQKLQKQATFYYLDSNDIFHHPRFNIIDNTILVSSSKGIHRIDENHNHSALAYKYTIVDVLTDEDGWIWAAEGLNGGLKAYSNEKVIGTNNFQILLEGVTPSTMLRDRDGGYWVTTLEKGIFYLRDKRVQIFDTQNAHFPSEFINSVEYFEHSKVFLGFKQSEVGIFDKKANTYQKIVRLDNENIFDIKWNAYYQKLWFGGFLLSQWQEGKLKTYGVSDNNSVGGLKKIALKSQKDDAWIISARGLHEVIGNNVSNYGVKNSNSISSRQFSIFVDSHNQLWVSKQDGLYHLVNDNLVAVPFIHAALKTRVEEMAELPNGGLVFATKSNGLVIYDTKKAVNITEADGLLTNMLENVVVDAKGNIWLGTLSGLHKLTLMPDDKWHIQPISMFHGLPTNEINDIAPTTEGVFLATSKGLVFYTDKPVNTTLHTPFLEYFKAAKKNKDLAESNVFTARENDIEIAWNFIDFQMSGKILYRYKLDSKDEWHYTINRTIQIPSLFQGDYTFEIQAQNENGIWSDSLKLPFTILPYWFETWWFRSLLIFLAMVGGYLFYTNRIKNLKKEHAIALQINDLERAALAAQMNPHFIFNCLNSIQMLIQRGEKEIAMNYMGQFASLVRSTLESTRRSRISVGEETQALEHYLSLEKLRFKDGLIYSIHIDHSIDVFDTEIPAMLIQPFVENAVKHGLSMEQSSEVMIRINKADTHYLFVEIEDNGKGFDTNQTHVLLYQADKRVNGVNKTGVGIALSRKRLALLNGRDCDKDLHIENKLNEKGENAGTKVKLMIRINPS